MLLQVLGACRYQYFIPFHGWTIFSIFIYHICLSLHQLMHMWVVSTLGLLYTCCYERACTGFFVDTYFQLSWGTYLEVEFLGHG